MAFATAPISGIHSAPSGLRNLARTLMASLRRRRAIRKTRYALSDLSDHMLRDLGLTRAGIDRAAIDATIGSDRF
ncbi:MAG: DUF1127 domain-containing protein [Rhodobacteraceae bacterium]|nr:DUF1127 domain-containing protein [Paracoccaceae bacterium]